MIWLWGPVMLDCHGNLEPTTIVYEFKEWAKRQIGETIDGYPIYATDLLQNFIASETQAPALFDPAPGEAAIVSVTAIDGAGNRDDDVCY